MSRFLFASLVACLLVAAVQGQVIDLPAFAADEDSIQDDLPTPHEIIDRHIAATGGRAAYARLENRRLVGTLHQNYQEMPLTLQQSAPSNQHAAVGVGGDTMLFVTNADESWTYDGDIVVASSGDQRSQEIRRAVFNVLLDWPSHYELSKTLGTVDVDGRPAYEVRLTAEDCHKVFLFFDQETGRHLRTEQEIIYAGDTIDAIATFSDYKPFDGIELPTKTHRVLTYSGGRIVQDYEFTKVEHNVDMPDDLFETPPELRAAAQ